MAARENQGLQIGLIILVMLTVILLVSNFLVFRSYQDAYSKMEAAKKDASDAQGALGTAVAELAEAAKLIGAPGESPKMADVKTFFDNDLKKYGGELPVEKQNYAGMLANLARLSGDLNKRLADEQGAFENLKGKYAQLQKEKDDTLAKNQQLIDQLKKELAAEQAAFAKQKKEIDASRDKMLADRSKDSEAAKAAKSALADADKSFKQRISDLQGQNQLLAIQIDKDRRDNLEAPDGKVTQVYAGSRIVYLNVGSADGVPRQATFSVYPRDSQRVASAERKGMLEVYRVIGPHQTEARILDEKPGDPILPGDQIYSPAWTPGRFERFAMAGMIDIDGDGKADVQRVRDLIELNGGKVDAVLDEKGQSPKGLEPDKMSVNTRYLIIGTAPSDVGANAAQLNQEWSRMHADALTKGIKLITVPEFLDYIGYRPQDRTVALGRDLDPKEFARRPQGTRRALYDVNKHRKITAPNSGPLPGTVKRGIDEIPSGMLKEVLEGRTGKPAAAAPAAGAAADEAAEEGADAEEPAAEGDAAAEDGALFGPDDAAAAPE
ncbi:MAG: hypothetical protein U0836_13480 [Pirellulales bacterium]